MDSEPVWPVQDRFLELQSRWMTLIGEHLQDDQGRILEYWRIEKADSAIALPLQGDRLLLPPPSYRPGVSQATLDFPGGRVSEGKTPSETAIATLKRELGIAETAIDQLIPLNHQGWTVNSSFSNQKLYGFVAQIQEETPLLPQIISYPANPTGIQQLLQNLTCLQCRAILLEWFVQNPTLQIVKP